MKTLNQLLREHNAKHEIDFTKKDVWKAIGTRKIGLKTVMMLFAQAPHPDGQPVKWSDKTKKLLADFFGEEVENIKWN